MIRTRRRAVLLALTGGAASALVGGFPLIAAAQVNRLGAWRRGIDGQRKADLGDGRYLNPVIAGDHPDPTVLKDGDHYYATFASLDYYPGLILWQSPDLVNWTPVGPMLDKPIGTVFAPELVKHNGRYFVYFAALRLPPASRDDAAEAPWRDAFSNHVIHADNIQGPWSAPVDLGVKGRYDPGHAVGEDGRRYLFFDDGYRVRLSDDGLRAVEPARKVYSGWPIPADMINEGFSLDSPKLVRRDGWYYLFSAQGGVAGPANGHMVVVARSRSIDGPWDNSPSNPMVRTSSRDDPWWSRGHATPVEGPDGRWQLVYSAFEKDLRSQGRPTILEPFEWGADGWPKALGGILDTPMRMPASVRDPANGRPLSGPFQPADLGARLAFFRPRAYYRSRLSFADGALTLRARGDVPGTSEPLALIPSDRRYDLTVEIDAQPGAEAGLLLFFNETLFCGLSAAGGELRRYKLGRQMRYPALKVAVGNRFYARCNYKEDVAQFFVSHDAKTWQRIMTMEVSGYTGNMTGGYLSLRPALFVMGKGSATFRALHYDGAI